MFEAAFRQLIICDAFMALADNSDIFNEPPGASQKVRDLLVS